MKVLVDTCVWSLALRRDASNRENPFIHELERLIQEARVQMIGPIRQEILSGIRSLTQFESLRNHLSAFPDLRLETPDYERAAEYFNIARGKGVKALTRIF